jgi:hypothetical protein
MRLVEMLLAVGAIQLRRLDTENYSIQIAAYVGNKNFLYSFHYNSQGLRATFDLKVSLESAL